MHESLLALLRCPFCGTRLQPVENHALVRDAEVASSPACSAASAARSRSSTASRCSSPTTRRGRPSWRSKPAAPTTRAISLLGLDGERRAAFRALLARGDAATYRDFIAVLSPDAEGTYFVYRFSDPTYVMAEGLLRGLAQTPATTARWVIDVCGGSGHLTRVLTEVQQASAAPGAGTVLADVYFAKLWLAARITAPACHPVCCDANHPLPFDSDACSLAVLSDAFPYIWHKRLLAGELMRLVGPAGWS